MKIFFFYAREHEPIPGQPPREPSMDAKLWMTMLKDSKTLTRKGDLRHDFPETTARMVFNSAQVNNMSL